MEKEATKFGPQRLSKWMRLGYKTTWIAMVAIIVTLGTFCPMAAGPMAGMACSDCHKDSCPATVCLTNTPYLTAQAVDNLSAGVVIAAEPASSLLQPTVEVSQFELAVDSPRAPSGPLFLRTHSLLI